MPLEPAAATPGAARWTLRLLGDFELKSSQGAQRHGKLGTRAAMALLTRLCLRPGSAHPREELVELLWPGVGTEPGRQRLRQTLSTLKQVLEPREQAGFQVIEADRLSIRLLPDRVLCDAVAFEAAFKRGDHDSARTLYAGDLLPGFFDEWISDERLRLEGLFDRLPLPAAPALSIAQWPAATRAAANAVQPGPATTLPAAQHAVLPAYLTRLIGAQPQIDRLQHAVAAQRLVTLLGPGGTGKTRLAVAVAQALATQGSFDTVVFVPLAACRTRQEMLDHTLLALRRPQGASGALAGVVHALDGRRALLVLDNFEQVADEGAEAVAELAAQLPLLHLLVTSRRVLDLPGESVLQADALALPAPDAALAQALLSPAVTLFIERARDARAEFHLHEGNRAAVLDLVLLLEGMPLAIELAAARVRSLSPAQMANTLRQARDGRASALDMLARAPQRGRTNTRHHSMQDAIAWSWQLLAPDQQALLAGLTVFQGGLTATAAWAVAGAPGSTAGAVALELDTLVGHSLLRRLGHENPGLNAHGDGSKDCEDGGAGEDVAADQNSQDEAHDHNAPRFALYEPIREFAQRSLLASATAALRQRHRAWALQWCLTLPATPPLAALRLEMPNLTAAMVHALADGEPDATVGLAVALQRVLENTVLPGAAQAALEGALANCADTALRYEGQVVLSHQLYRSGQPGPARALLLQALGPAAAGAPAAPAVRARALVYLVMLSFGSGDRSAQLRAWGDEAQRLAEQVADPWLLARVAGVRADLAGMVDQDFERAAGLHQQALAGWQAQGDRLATLRTRYSAMQVVAMRHEHSQLAWVDAQANELLDQFRRLQSPAMQGHCLHVLGSTRVRQRRWAEAIDCLALGIQLAWQELDSYNCVAAILVLLHPLARDRRSGGPAAAQQLAGFTQAFFFKRFEGMQGLYARELRLAARLGRAQLGAAASDAAFAHGRGLGLAQAVALALSASQQR